MSFKGLRLLNPEFGRAVAQLVVGHIVAISSQPCCPKWCATCSALTYFRDDYEADRALAEWIRDWDPIWDFTEASGYVLWEVVEGYWTLTECHDEEDEDGQVRSTDVRQG